MGGNPRAIGSQARLYHGACPHCFNDFSESDGQCGQLLLCNNDENRGKYE